MVEQVWDDIQEKQVKYQDRIWEITGKVVVKESGDLICVEATQLHDVRNRRATLYFTLQTPNDSLNPGNLGEHFDRIEQSRSNYFLIVKKGTKTYRYILQRLEYCS